MAARERLEDAFSDDAELPAAQVCDRRIRALPLPGGRPWLEP
jgi:hypothetical protein